MNFNPVKVGHAVMGATTILSASAAINSFPKLSLAVQFGGAIGYLLIHLFCKNG